MRVFLISVNKEKSLRPALPAGMASIAAEAKKHGHEVGCLDLCFEHDDDLAVTTALEAFQPAVIGLSFRNLDTMVFLEPGFFAPLLRRIAGLCRKRSPKSWLVLGGAGFTQTPEALMRYTRADFGIAGVGERAFPILLDSLEQGTPYDQVPGLVYLGPDGKAVINEPDFDLDLDATCFPAQEFYDERYFTYKHLAPNSPMRTMETVQSKKGCLLSCIFCSNMRIEGTKIRLKSPGRTIDEIERILALEHSMGFEFTDSVFNIPYDHALAVCDAMLRRKIRAPWTCMFNPWAVTSELVDKMAKTGCYLVQWGTDAVTDITIRSLKKPFTKEQVVASHKIAVEHGIETQHCIFIGSPGETRDTVMETLERMDSLCPNGDKRNQVFFALGIRISYGTRLHELAIEEGLVSKTDDLVVPRFYIPPSILSDDLLLEKIQDAMITHNNWYLWWGLNSIPLKEQIKRVQDEYRKIECLFSSATGSLCGGPGSC